jgi:hypothetical protein
MIFAIFAEASSAIAVAESAAWALGGPGAPAPIIDCLNTSPADVRVALGSISRSLLAFTLLGLDRIADPEIRSAVDLAVVVPGETQHEVATAIRLAAAAELPGLTPPWLLTSHLSDPTFGIRVLPASPPARDRFVGAEFGAHAQIAIALGAALLAAAADPLAPFVDEAVIREIMARPATAAEHDLRDRLRELAFRFDDAALPIPAMPPRMRRDLAAPRRSASRPSPATAPRRLASRA